MDELVQGVFGDKFGGAVAESVGEPESFPDFYELVKGAHKKVKVTPPIDEDSKFSTYDFNRLCPWEEILCSIHGITRTETLTGVRSFPLRIGHAFHSMVQNEFFPHGVTVTRDRHRGSKGNSVVMSADKMWLGWWQCTNCADVIRNDVGVEKPVDTWMSRPEVCPTCGMENEFLFHEPEAERGLFLSHSDGGVLWKGRVLHVEIKTCSSVMFLGKFGRASGYRERPDEDHVVQVMLNQYTNRVGASLLVYINKQAESSSQMFATHVVKYDEGIVSAAVKKADTILKGVHYRALPKGECWRSCRDSDDERSKSCAIAPMCPISNPECTRGTDFFLVSDDGPGSVAI